MGRVIRLTENEFHSLVKRLVKETKYQYDEDLDDESTIRKIKLETKKAVAEAKKFFNNQIRFNQNKIKFFKI